MRGARASAKGNEWLLLKEKDAAARSGDDVATRAPESVATGRDLEEIASDRDRTWQSNRVEAPPRVARRARPGPELGKAPRRAAPKEIRPQLATLADRAPAGDEWLHEMKLDGYRILARLAKKRVELLDAVRPGLDRPLSRHRARAPRDSGPPTPGSTASWRC